MVYSVFSWDDGQYHFFEVQGEQLGQRPQPRQRFNDPNGTGKYLEAVLPVLPPGARRVGHGAIAKGRIAIHPTSPAAGLGQYSDPSESPLVSKPWTTLAIGAGAVLLSYKLLLYIARRI